MTNNFCTLCDKNYLFRVLALYYSLSDQSDNFRLWILCTDLITYNLLEKMSLPCITIIHIQDIETPELLTIKTGRNTAEYSWTLKPYLIKHIFTNYNDVDIITYIDADVFFFSNPSQIIKELGDNSILITPHNLSPHLKHIEATRGTYNAGLIVFKRNDKGLRCLETWRDKCTKWCFHRYEDGKSGDQYYLNEWPKENYDVKISENSGLNTAPWNVDNYKISYNKNQVFIEQHQLIVFHFHSFKLYSETKFELSNSDYNLNNVVIEQIYKPYINKIKESIKTIHTIDRDFNYGFSRKPSVLKQIIKHILNKKKMVM